MRRTLMLLLVVALVLPGGFPSLAAAGMLVI